MPKAKDATCAKGGMLVGTDIWIPDDPSEHFVDDSEMIGCNRLFCSHCRSWVRHLDDVAFADRQPPSADIARIYADPDAEKYAGFDAGSLGHRVYLCRCSSVATSGIKELGWLDWDRWDCAGHPAPRPNAAPPPSPPATDDDVERMLRSSTSGWDFALRWRQPFIFSTVWPVVKQLLVDPAPTIRLRALELVDAWRAGNSPTVTRLMDIARRQSSVYTEPDVRAAFARTLAGKAASMRSLRSTIANGIVAFLGDEPPPTGAASLCAEYEPVAVTASATRWRDTAQDQAAAKEAAEAMALYRRDHLLALLAALARGTTTSRQEIMAAVEERLALSDDQLRLILASDDIPAPQTRPSVEDCRRALSLA